MSGPRFPPSNYNSDFPKDAETGSVDCQRIQVQNEMLTTQEYLCVLAHKIFIYVPLNLRSIRHEVIVDDSIPFIMSITPYPAFSHYSHLLYIFVIINVGLG